MAEQAQKAKAGGGGKAEEKARAEERSAQAIASTQGAVPPPQPPDEPLSDEEVERREEAQKVAGELGDLDFETLTRLRGAVDKALENKGTEPEKAGPSLEEVSGSLPINVAATEELSDKGIKAIAKEADLEEEEVIDFAVRQATNAVGGGRGPQYLRVIKPDGSKVTVRRD